MRFPVRCLSRFGRKRSDAMVGSFRVSPDLYSDLHMITKNTDDASMVGIFNDVSQLRSGYETVFLECCGELRAVEANNNLVTDGSCRNALELAVYFFK